MKVSGKILPGSVRVSVMAEGQRPRKTKRKREKATPVNAEIQAAVEKERHAQSIARAKRNIEDIAQCNQWDWFATFTVAPDCRELAKYNGDTAGLCIKCLRSIKNKYKATDMKWLLVPEPPEASESKEENRSICIKAADTASLPERFGRAFLGRACNRPWLVLNLTGPCRGVIRSRVVGSLSPREK